MRSTLWVSEEPPNPCDTTEARANDRAFKFQSIDESGGYFGSPAKAKLCAHVFNLACGEGGCSVTEAISLYFSVQIGDQSVWVAMLGIIKA